MIMDTIEGRIIGVIDYLSSIVIFDFMSTKNKINYSHRDSFMSYFEEKLECFAYFNSQTRLAIRSKKIPRLSHRDKA
jgi:hypothetical protein